MKEYAQYAIGPEGVIRAGVPEWLKGAVADTGAVGGAIHQAVTEQVSEVVRNPWEADAAKAYPYRAHLQSMALGDWQLAWQRILIDEDEFANMAAAMGDAGTASIVSLAAAYPDNSSLLKLRDAAQMKKHASFFTEGTLPRLHRGAR